MFEGADAVSDARGFLTGTGHSSALAEGGTSPAGVRGPFLLRGAAAPQRPSSGGRGLGARGQPFQAGGPARQRASLPFCSDYYIRCHGEGKRGEGAAALARGRAAGPGADPPVRPPRALLARAPVPLGPAGGERTCPPRPPRPGSTLGQRSQRAVSAAAPGSKRFWLQAFVVL